MSVRLLRAADRAATPWRNGRGVTHEVAASPEGAGLDDFAWRVSLAGIEKADPFSPFPGVDRTFAVVEGVVSLAIGGARPLLMMPEDDPAAFPGEAEATAEAVGGPACALNVMTRRGRAAASMRRTLGEVLSVTAGPVVVVALGPLLLQSRGGPRERLARYDAALAGGPTSLAVEGEAWLIGFAV